MPYADPKKHRDYYRDYMRRYRSADHAASPPSNATKAELLRQLKRAHALIRRLEQSSQKTDPASRNE
jgi:hypothetical protein